MVDPGQHESIHCADALCMCIVVEHRCCGGMKPSELGGSLMRENVGGMRGLLSIAFSS